MWESHYEAGQNHLKAQAYNLAVVEFQNALRTAPETECVHEKLIETYLQQGSWEAALMHLQSLLEQFPHQSTYWRLLGDLYTTQENYSEALSAYRVALQKAPQSVMLIQKATETALYLRQIKTALSIVHEGLLWGAQAPELHLLQAKVLYVKGESKTAAEICEQLYLTYTDRLDILNQWLHYLSTDNPHKALAFLITLAQHKPENKALLATQAAHLQRSLGEVEEAKQSLRVALQDKTLPQRSAYQLLHDLMHPMISQSEAEIAAYRRHLNQWAEQVTEQALHSLSYEENQLTPAFKILSLLAFLPYLNINTLAARNAYGAFLQASLPQRPALLPRSFQLPHLIFVVHKNSPVFQFVQGLLVHWPEDWKVTIAILHSDAFDQTFEQSLKRQRPDFNYLQLSSQPALALQQLEHLQAQIIFYTEVYADTPLQTFLASQRLAPVQVTSWLSSGSSGLNTLDYYISPRCAEQKQAQDFYSEQLILTENLPAYIMPPAFTAKTPCRSDYDLPEDKHLYLCPHLLFKLSPGFDFVLSGILEKDPQGVVILQARPAIENIHHKMLQRLEQQIPHCMDRIWFVPVMEQSDFYGLMHLADVFLDPFHFGGGTTSFEALAFDLPIVTWPGERLHGRITYAYYQRMGVLDAVALNPEDYIEKAVNLGTQKSLNQALRHKIAQHKHKIFQQEAAVTELSECLYRLLPRKPDPASLPDAPPFSRTS